MNKRDLIYQLKNVRLVIGNGFDLYCGIKTKYSDFFLSDTQKNEILGNWLSDFSYKVRYYVDFSRQITNRSLLWVNFECIDKVNFWDVFFFLVSYEESSIETWKWCDIEKIMEYWLLDKKETGNENFKMVFNLLKGNTIPSNVGLKVQYLAAICYKFNDEKEFENELKFYYFLLEQLKKFEKNFGNYIYHQQYNAFIKILELYLKVNYFLIIRKNLLSNFVM